MVENNDYLIHELAEKANVSVRTIRYYLDERLLPPPQVKGRYALFSTEHLERLELIRRLKDAYLPLKEIRQKMDSLSGLEVHDLLKKSTDQLVQPTKDRAVSMPEQKTADSSALDYIARLLETHPASPPAQSISMPFALRSPAPQENVQAILSRNPSKAAQQGENETWSRVVLAPGIELHLRQPPGVENENKVRQIMDLAKRLFRS